MAGVASAVRGFGVALLALMTTGMAWSQSAEELQRSLESSLLRKQLPIRDFLADTDIYYVWDADHLGHEREKIFTLGMFQAESIKVHGSQGRAESVTILGTRRTLMNRNPDAKDALSRSAERITFHVNLQGADAATVQNLVVLLFFPDAASAINAVPGEIATLLPTKEKDTGGWVRIDGEWKQLPPGEKLQPSKVLFAAEPEFSEEARKAKRRGGNVNLGLSVGMDGTVAGAWLIRPLGLGLDEKAEEAAFKYKFEPAMYRGEAVGIVEPVEVNFQIF